MDKKTIPRAAEVDEAIGVVVEVEKKKRVFKLKTSKGGGR